MDFDSIKDAIRKGDYDKAKSLLEEVEDVKNTSLMDSMRLLVDYELTSSEKIIATSEIKFKNAVSTKKWKDIVYIGGVRTQILADLGKYNETLETAQIIISNIEGKEIKDHEILNSLGFMYNSYGNALFRLGRHNEALELYFTSLKYREKLEDSYSIAASYGNIANIYNETGSLVKAEEYYLKSLDGFEKSGYDYETRVTYNNLGVVYMGQGRLDEADEMLMKSMKISEKYNDEMMIGVCYNNFGSVLRSKNQIENSLKYYLDSFEIRKMTNNPYQLSYSYYYLTLTYLDLGDKDMAGHYLGLMKNLHTSNKENKMFEVKYKILHSAVLKSSVRSTQRAKAQNLILEIINDENNPDVEITIQACIFYCELLLAELSIAKETDTSEKEELEIIAEVKSYTAKISQMAEKANLIGMKIQAMILQSYVELSQLQIELAKELIDEAKMLSEKFEIRYFPVAIPDDVRLADISESKGYSAGSLEVKQSINKIIHSLPRLRIIFYLFDKPFATFMEMKQTLGFSPGKLGKHCDHLTEVGYIDKRKEFDGNKYVTAYRLTPLGLQEFRTYAEGLKYQLQAVSSN